MFTLRAQGLWIVVFISAAVACAQDSPPTEDALDRAIADETYRQITSVLATEDGSPLLERYYGDGCASCLNDTRSATKSIAALALGHAITGGDIAGVDASLASIMGEFSGDSVDDPITLADLLTMSSALHCNDDDMATPGNEEHMYQLDDWLAFARAIPRDAEYRRDSNGRGRFSYCTAGTFLLGQVLERATGTSVDSYIEQQIFAPLGIEEVQWAYSNSGQVQTGGGTRLRSVDLMKLGELARLQGSHEGTEILPAVWVEEMLTKRLEPYPDVGYGFQWWQQSFACGENAVDGWYMSGNGGNKVVVIDELDATIVVTATLYGTRGMHQQSTDLIERHVLPRYSACETSAVSNP